MKFNVYQLMLSVIMCMVCISVSFYVHLNTYMAGYDLLYILPILYLVCFVILLNRILFYQFNMFIASFVFISFLRYVMLPLFIAASGWYDGRAMLSPMPQSFETAIYLMMWELVVTTLACSIYFIRVDQKFSLQEKKEIDYPKSTLFYWIFIIFSIGLAVVFPAALKGFAFIKLNDNVEDIMSGSFFETITQYCLITSKYLLFLMGISHFKRKFDASKNQIYIFSSFVLIILNIGIIFGDNRMDFLVSAIASLYLFSYLFKKKAIPYVLISSALIVTIFSFISDKRATTTSTGGTNPLADMTDLLQVYLGGPYNVALAIELTEYYPHFATLGNLFYDLTRPIIGLGMIVKNLEGFYFSNYLFNERIYFSDHVSQILPMIGQGNYYFGFFAAPIFNVVVVFFTFYLFYKVNKIQRIELIFFLTIPIIRLSMMMGQNIGILLNDTSFFLLLNLTVYYINNKLVRKRE